MMVLIGSLSGPAILCCSGCIAQVRCPPSHLEGESSDSEASMRLASSAPQKQRPPSAGKRVDATDAQGVSPLQRSAGSSCARREDFVIHRYRSPGYEMIVEDLAELPFGPTFRTPFYVFESFLLDSPTTDDLPAKQGGRAHRILDFAQTGEKPGKRNHPSIRCSMSKERLWKHALIAQI
jgi:hypothetical protein